jgi:hypothetical protein
MGIGLDLHDVEYRYWAGLYYFWQLLPNFSGELVIEHWLREPLAFFVLGFW